GSFETDLVGIFAEGADVGNDHGSAHSKRAQQRAGAFAYGRVAKIQNDVAGANVAVEVFDGSEAEMPNMRRQAHRVNHRLPPELCMSFADQNHPLVRRTADQPSK